MNIIRDAVAWLFGSKDKYAHGELKVRANTLVIDEAVYPIENVSAVVLQDLRRPVPLFVWIMGAVGVLMFLSGELWSLLGFPLLTLTVVLLVLNYLSRSAADYGLNVRMNGGNTAAVLSNDKAFLQSIAEEMYAVIELGKRSSTTFNIDQRVRIDSVTGSTVGIAGIQGSLLDQLPSSAPIPALG